MRTSSARPMSAAPRVRYVAGVTWIGRLMARLRSIDAVAVDVALAVAFAVVGVATAFAQDIHDGSGALVVATASPACCSSSLSR